MPAPRTITLLHIEPDAHAARQAHDALERLGYRVESVRVADDAQLAAALERPRFDFVLGESGLPAPEGVGALERVVRHAPSVPFIVFSRLGGEARVVDRMRRGAADYVLKDDPVALAAAVERVLARTGERPSPEATQDALLSIREHAYLAVEAARLGMWEYEPLTDTLHWDARCKAMFGLPPEAEVSLAVFEARCHPDDRARMQNEVRQAIEVETDQAYHSEYRILLEDGVVHWVVTRGRAFFEDGVCVRFLGVLQDITEQRQATESLQRLNAVLGERVEKRTRERDRTWELSRDMLAVIAFDSMPLALNPAWEYTLGWSREELSRKPLLDLVHPDDRPMLKAKADSLRRGLIAPRFDIRMRHARGVYRWLSWTAVPEDGAIYAAARDITSEIAAMEELASANRKLREQIGERERVEATLQQMQRLEAVGQLTAGVAHDFNNLLTVILASASFLTRDLEKGVEPEKLLQRLHNIKEAGERGARLTNQLLAFSRRQRLVPEAVDLNETLLDTLDLLESTLGGSVLIETDMQPGLWRALVDPTQIELILLNLAINGRDAMPVGGTLRLGTANETVTRAPSRPEDPEPGEYVVLKVEDTGSGMSDEVLAKAFEPFFTTKDVGKGSGLGLPQVFGFAKQSGGGVGIETRLGRGTTVKVYLPRVTVQPVALATTPTADASAALDGPTRTILLVDDDDRVREVTAALLERFGYQVLAVNSGVAALTVLAERPVDLLLADFAMPGMNGAELARTARERWPGLPVVFITGYAEFGQLNAGETLIVAKPFSEDTLRETLLQAFLASRYPRDRGVASPRR